MIHTEALHSKNMHQHIEAEITMTDRQHFEMQFPEWKYFQYIEFVIY